MQETVHYLGATLLITGILGLMLLFSNLLNVNGQAVRLVPPATNVMAVFHASEPESREDIPFFIVKR